MVLHARHRAPGGEDVAVAVEVDALRDAGVDVHAVEFANPHGAAVLTKFAGAPWNLAAAREVVRIAERFRPDVVHVHNTWFALSPAVIPALTRAGFPVVETLHNYRHMCLNATFVRDDSVCHDCLGNGPMPGIRNRCYRGSAPGSAVAAVAQVLGRTRARPQVARFIAPSQTVRDLHIAAGFDPADIELVEHGIADPGSRVSAPSASRRVVWIGRLAPGKGIDGLLRAWRDHAPDGFELDVLGDGPLRDQIIPVLPRGVRLHGHVDRATVLETLRSASAFVFTSEWEEPFGLVLLEAMAAGTPIVAFSTADTERIVGVGGRYLPVGDHIGLLRSLASYTGPERDAASAVVRRRYEAHYTASAHASRLIDLFERVHAEHTASR